MRAVHDPPGWLHVAKLDSSIGPACARLTTLAGMLSHADGLRLQARGDVMGVRTTQARVLVLPALSAGALVVGTLLPWRVTRGVRSNGWSTAHLALGIGQSFEDTRLKAAAGAWFCLPVLAALTPIALAILPRAAGRRVARTLAFAALLIALTTSLFLRSNRLAGETAVGPSVVVASATFLLLLCWTAPVLNPDPRSELA